MQRKTYFRGTSALKRKHCIVLVAGLCELSLGKPDLVSHFASYNFLTQPSENTNTAKSPRMSALDWRADGTRARDLRRDGLFDSPRGLLVEGSDGVVAIGDGHGEDGRIGE